MASSTTTLPFDAPSPSDASLEETHSKVVAAFTSPTFEEDAKTWLKANGLWKPSDQEDGEDEEDWMVCWTIYHYIAHLWGVNAIHIVSNRLSWHQILTEAPKGLYVLSFGVEIEDHTCLAWLRQDGKVRIYQGYGGEYHPSYFEAELSEWLNPLISPAATARERYEAIYGTVLRIRPATTFRLGVDYSSDTSAWISRLI